MTKIRVSLYCYSRRLPNSILGGFLVFFFFFSFLLFLHDFDNSQVFRISRTLLRTGAVTQYKMGGMVRMEKFSILVAQR